MGAAFFMRRNVPSQRALGWDLLQAAWIVLVFSPRNVSLTNRKASKGVAGTRESCCLNSGIFCSRNARLRVILSSLNFFSLTRWGRITDDSFPALSRAVIRILSPSLEA